MKQKNWLNSIKEKLGFPEYSYRPALITFLSYLLTYTLPQVIHLGIAPRKVAIAWDAMIPFWPPAVIVYVLSYFQWLLIIGVVMRQRRELCERIFRSVTIALWISFFIFIFLPTYVIRPEITGNGICDWILRYVYAVDPPTRVLPSFHVIASWFCTRALFLCCDSQEKYGFAGDDPKRNGITGGDPRRSFGKCTRPWAWVNLIFSILVFVSILLVKQHVILDIPSALIVTELGFLLEKLWPKKNGNDAIPGSN